MRLGQAKARLGVPWGWVDRAASHVNLHPTQILKMLKMFTHNQLTPKEKCSYINLI